MKEDLILGKSYGIFPKGSREWPGRPLFSYQNVAYCVIEEVMNATTGKYYPQLLQERIFQPAGMHFASCDFLTMRMNSNKALPHFWTGSSWRSDTISPYYYNAAAAGGVNASISDMGIWLELYLANASSGGRHHLGPRIYAYY